MLLSVTFCDGQVSGEAKYLVGDSIILSVKLCCRLHQGLEASRQIQ